jgi:hypothetical protein
LKAINKLPPEPEKLPEAFKKYLVEPGLVSPWYADVFGRVIEMRKMLENKKMEDIPERDVYMSKEYVRRFIMDVRKVIESRRPELKTEIPEGPAEKMENAKQAIETAKELDKKVGDAAAGVCMPVDSKLQKVEKKLKAEEKKHDSGKRAKGKK